MNWEKQLKKVKVKISSVVKKLKVKKLRSYVVLLFYAFRLKTANHFPNVAKKPGGTLVTTMCLHFVKKQLQSLQKL